MFEKILYLKKINSMDNFLVIATFWFLLSFLLAFAAEKFRYNFHKAFLISIFLSPIVGYIVIFVATDSDTQKM